MMSALAERLPVLSSWHHSRQRFDLVRRTRALAVAAAAKHSARRQFINGADGRPSAASEGTGEGRAGMGPSSTPAGRAMLPPVRAAR
jgi:hypothetical protein